MAAAVPAGNSNPGPSGGGGGGNGVGNAPAGATSANPKNEPICVCVPCYVRNDLNDRLLELCGNTSVDANENFFDTCVDLYVVDDHGKVQRANYLDTGDCQKKWRVILLEYCQVCNPAKAAALYNEVTQKLGNLTISTSTPTE